MPLTRRALLRRSALGFGSLGLYGLLADEAAAASANPMEARAPHFAPRAKRVIHIFLNGGLFAGVYRPRPIQKLLSSPLGHLIGPLLPRSAVARALRSVFSTENPPSEKTMAQCLELIEYKGGRRVAHLVGTGGFRAPNQLSRSRNHFACELEGSGAT